MSSPARTVLLTGVTGLVGGAIALELLRSTDSNLLCVIRPQGAASPNERLIESLQNSARAYGDELDDRQLIRCRAVAGDITEAAAGVDPSELGPIDETWHVAASLAFEEERAREITLHNVVGTENVLNLARTFGCTKFNHVSTAYVAGSARGHIREDPVPDTAVPNNHYERTKTQAERLVLDAGFQTTRIFRPSIVIGHSKTYGAVTFSGLYGFVRGIQRARDNVRSSLGDLLRYRPLRLLADGDTPVNFIPVDYVACAAVTISEKSQKDAIYHLTNHTPPRLADTLKGITEVLNIQQPFFVCDSAEFTLIDEKVDDEMTFYRSYINDEKYFDATNVQQILGQDALSCDLPADEIARYVEWYVNRSKRL